MERELQILTLMEDNPAITQRELAKETGLALGTVNNVIQKMVTEDWLEVRQITPRTVEYRITNIGNVYKATAYQSYIEESYKAISDFKRKLKMIIENQIELGYRYFWLIGEDNDIYRLLKMTMLELKRVYDIDYKYVMKEPTSNKPPLSLTITWDSQIGQKENTVNLLYTNLS